MSLLKGDVITLPKALKGLGIIDFDTTNLLMLGKLAWNLMLEGQALWFQVIRNKYLKIERDGSIYINKIISHNWKALKSIKDFVQFRLKWVMRNGTRISFGMING